MTETTAPHTAAANDAGPFCIAVEQSTDALCHKDPGHDGPHNGWAHYPGQMTTWPNTPIPPASTEESA